MDKTEGINGMNHNLLYLPMQGQVPKLVMKAKMGKNIVFKGGVLREILHCFFYQHNSLKMGRIRCWMRAC